MLISPTFSSWSWAVPSSRRCRAGARRYRLPVANSKKRPCSFLAMRIEGAIINASWCGQVLVKGSNPVVSGSRGSHPLPVQALVQCPAGLLVLSLVVGVTNKVVDRRVQLCQGQLLAGVANTAGQAPRLVGEKSGVDGAGEAFALTPAMGLWRGRRTC